MRTGIIATSLGQVGGTIFFILGGVLLLEVLLWGVGRVFRMKNMLLYMLLAPGIVGLILLVVYPLVFELALAFSNMSLRTFKHPTFGIKEGIDNFVRVFTRPVLKQTYFFPIFFRTVLWTVIQVSAHVTLGLGLAILLNRPMFLKNIYKAFLILPWAIPDIISGLAWRGEFHYEYGVFNIILTRLGADPIPWKSDPLWNFIAMNITNIWLGVPFMMVISLGGLQSISKEYYEAAQIDGATSAQKLWYVTLPLLKPILTPAVILGVIWTFNNFNVPYFINQNELESSDLLVTALFRAAFEYNQYGFAAAFAFVVFLVLLFFSLWYIRITGGLKGVKE
ncbi:carbohydrate ABC transporter permease [Spirochaeta thermophila]|uniref:Transporter n=1 Tax=Winmispira thermophila (strain ATCC 49972 / DSM 6192 / RI 19.B1) TaxID=665571 RepID=E0RSH6_WINT6|nr:sugar ABC transporter permease [Spirochaeta thermophila]ADN01963.1 transporter [Spirochaeta thermophila DSM 6192]